MEEREREREREREINTKYNTIKSGRLVLLKCIYRFTDNNKC